MSSEQELKGYVVKIRAYEGTTLKGNGSGIIIGPDLILTAAHVACISGLTHEANVKPDALEILL